MRNVDLNKLPFPAGRKRFLEDVRGERMFLCEDNAWITLSDLSGDHVRRRLIAEDACCRAIVCFEMMAEGYQYYNYNLPAALYPCQADELRGWALQEQDRMRAGAAAWRQALRQIGG